MRLARVSVILVIGLISLSALALRLWHIDWPGPFSYHRDELKKIEMIDRLAGGAHGLDYFKHPHFLLMSSAELVRLSKLFQSELDQRAEEAIIRRWGAVLSAMTVLFTGLLGYRWRGAAVGIGAAIFLAVLPLHVLLAHYIKEDTGLTFWLVLACGAAQTLRITKRRRLWFFLAGTTCGGALAAKWVGALAFIPVVFVMCRRLREERVAGTYDKRLKWLFVFGAASQWFIWHPWFLNDLFAFTHDFSWSFAQGMSKHAGVVAFGFQYLFTWHLWHSLLPGMGITVVVLAVAGLVMALRKRYGDEGMLIAWFALVIYVPTELSPLKATLNSERYMAGALPFLALLAAAALAQFSQWLACRWSRPRLTGWLNLAFIPIAAIVPLANSVAFSKNIADDNRTLAREWMLTNLPRGSTIAMMGFSEYNPQQVESRGLQIVSTKPVDGGFSPETARQVLEKYDYFCVSSFDMWRSIMWPYQTRKEVEFYQWLFKNYPVAKAFLSNKPSAFWPASFSTPIEYGFNQPSIWILKIHPTVDETR